MPHLCYYCWFVLLRSYNQTISLPLNTKMFYPSYQKAKEKLKENVRQSIEYYRQALQHRPDLNHKEKENEDEATWGDYFSVKIQFGGVLRDQGLRRNEKGHMNQQLILQCSDLFVELIKEFKEEEIADKLNKDEETLMSYSLFQNYAKLLLGLAQFELEKDQYDKYRNKLNTSFQYFRKSQDIIVGLLNGQLSRTGVVQGKWTERYMLLLSNLSQLLFMESQSFMDKKCIDQIINAEQYIQKFYKLNKKNKENIDQHMTRYRYNKASALTLINRPKEANHLLLKVYEDEKRRGFKEDAEKSRSQIFLNLLRINQIKEAEKYVSNSSSKSNLRSLQARRQQFKNFFSQPERVIRQYRREQIENIFEEFQEQINQYTYDFQSIDKYVSPIVKLFKDKTQEKELLYYYLSEANFQLRRYKKSLEMIEQALRVSPGDRLDQMDWRIQQFKVKIFINPKDLSLDKMLSTLKVELGKSYKMSQDKPRIQGQIQLLKDAQKQLTKERKKASDPVYYCLLKDSDKMMISALEKANSDRQKMKSTVDLHKYDVSHMDIQQDIYPNRRKKIEPDRSSHDQRQSANMGYRPFKLPELNPEQLYIKTCQQKKVIERPQIRKYLSSQNSNFNPFSDMLNLSQTEVEVLLSFVKVTNLDLRKHHFNDLTLQTILNSPDLSAVKQFKVSGSNLISHQMLLTTISNMSHLQYLSFLDFPAHRPRIFNQVENMTIAGDESQGKARNVVHMLSLMARSRSQNSIHLNLKVLKLKYCNLMDDHMKQMMLERYANLEEVSLSHNLLNGRQLSCVMSLKELAQLNISDNPLNTLDYDRWKSKMFDLRIRSLKIRNTVIQGDYLSGLKSLLLKVSEFDCSQCQNIGALIEGLISNSFDGFTAHFRKFGMRHTNLHQIGSQRILDLARSTQILDLRYCSYPPELKQNIQLELMPRFNTSIKISPSTSEPSVISKFSL